jgi:predicted RNA-binding Zn ribbon-like protein
MSVTTKKILRVMSRPVKSVKRSRAGMMLVMTVPSWVPGPETKPAPMPLLLVQSFVNTWDGDYGSDLLLDPATARDWLTKTGLWNADRPPTPAELDLARRVRENIRAMLVANRGGSPLAPADLQAIQAITHDAWPALHIGPSGRVSLAPQPPGRLEAALLTLLLAIRDAQRDGTWRRLKACGNPDCRWAFYDRSHSRAGAWCDMATCGNRIKNRRLRQRQR